MSRRLAVVIATAAGVAALALPAQAGPGLVHVYTDPDNGRVGVWAGTSDAHPIVHAGADVGARQVCGGLSYQTSQCVSLGGR